jgi:glyoxylate reductase
MARKYAILLTRLIPGPAVDLLKRHFELEINPGDKPISRTRMLEAIKDKHGLLCLLTDKIDKEVLEKGRGLRVIANYAVGYDNIDIAAANQKRIAVTNTPGVLTETTADLTFALILSIARRIVEADRFLRRGRFRGWAPMLMLGADVYGKTLGIIGLGRIGQGVARRARGFGIKIIYHEPKRLTPECERECGAEYRGLDDLLRESDFVTIHCPLNRSTFHLISQEEFFLMRKTAFLINTARGSIIDEQALLKALKKRRIAGAALDVFEKEPRVAPELVKMDNVVLVPHIGSASIETRTRMAMMAAENILAVLVKKQRPPNVVNPMIYDIHGP